LVESRKPEKLKDHLVYFEDEEIAGLGMPAAFATGKASDVTRAALSRQEYLMKLSLNSYMDECIETIENKLFVPMALQYGFFEKKKIGSRIYKVARYPKINHGAINLEELDSKSARLVEYAKVGLLTPDKFIEEQIRKSEGLPDMSGGNYDAH
jgi:hypothetical protein